MSNWTDKVDTLQEIAEFDCPFRVHSDGSLSRELDVWEPEVYHSETDDIEIADMPSCRWEALRGYTGQYGYNGAVLHASELLGGGLARDILAEPGVYVCVVVNVLECDDTCFTPCEGDHEPAGWAVLRLVESDE